MPWILGPEPSPTPAPAPLPPPGGFTEGVLESYTAWRNADSDNYLSALGSMYEPVFGIVVDEGDPDDSATYVPGWSILLDVDECPTEFLPYLGQFHGASIQPGTPDAVARSQIIDGCALNRGTIASMQWAARQNLIGAKTLQIIERTAANGSPDAYHMIIIFLQQECPSEAALITAVEEKKPGGIQVTYTAATGFEWFQATGTWAQDTMTWAQTASIQP